jgi:hypothetical protein
MLCPGYPWFALVTGRRIERAASVQVRNRWVCRLDLPAERRASVRPCGQMSSRHIQRVPSKVRVDDPRRAAGPNRWFSGRVTSGGFPTSRHFGWAKVGKAKQRYHFTPAIGEPFAFVWRWENWSKVIGTGSSADRMPTALWFNALCSKI